MKRYAGIAVTFIAILTGSSKLQAAGFALTEHNSSGLGRAYAGAAAVADDASTIFFNPAGLVTLKKDQLLFSTQAILVGAEFHNNGSTVNPQLTGGADVPISDGGSNEGGENALVPSFYYSAVINDSLALGVGVSVPFGLATKYDEDWVGRYHAVESAVETININPTIAYKLNKEWSFGFGVNLQHLDVKLSNMIDTAAVCLRSAGATVCGNINTALLQAGNADIDSKVSLTGSEWGYGYNFGVIYEPSAGNRIGFSYRSKISYDIDGNADFDLSDEMAIFLAAVSSPYFSDTGGKAKLVLPEIASLAGRFQVSNNLALLADITWTRWSRFKELRVEFENGQSETVIPENWGNSIKIAFGGDYRLNNLWLLRAGIAYDKTPIPDSEHRTARIPATSRKVFSLGLQHKITKKVKIDAGYIHLFIDDPEINNIDSSFGHTLNGNYSSSVDIFGAQLTWDL